jgi:hypothetical protein
VRHRHDDDLNLSGSIKDVEGKTLKNELACAVISKREGVWGFRDSGYGVVNSVGKSDRTYWTAFEIPITCVTKFAASLRVKPNSHSD